MKYIVMECHFSYAILLDEEGRFLKAANRGYQVGQSVYDPVIVGSYRYRPPMARIAARGVALVVACLLVILGITYYRYNMEAVSTIVMTINPEVKMELNRKGEVLELVGINADGMTLIAGYEFEGKDKITVADALIDRAIEQGYLTEGGTIAFTVDSKEDDLLPTYRKELMEEIAAYLAGRIHVEITVIGEDLPAPNGTTSTTTDDKPPATGNPDPSDYIGLDRAKEIALSHAKLTDASFESAELEEDGGVMVYELDFIADGIEYEYEIDALTGKILKHKSESIH
jgi:uncharacterized membrane protein YkoI